MGTTGLVYHPVYLEHDMGTGHPESPHRLRAIMQQLEQSGTMLRVIRIEPRKAEDEWISEIAAYVAWLTKQAPVTGRVSLDADTSMSSGSLGAAYLAANRRDSGRGGCNHGRAGGTCVLRRASPWPSCGGRARNGILSHEQCCHSRTLCAEEVWCDPCAHRGLGRASWEWNSAQLRRRSVGIIFQYTPIPPLPWNRGTHGNGTWSGGRLYHQCADGIRRRR